MTYTIPPGTPKALKAAAFGRELAKALRARNVSINELHRVTGIGDTSLDNYRTGRVLPKVSVAAVIATTLQWPRLAEMIVAARTFECRRAGCSRTFRNDTGAPRKFCSEDCQRLNEKLKATADANRRDGRAGVWSSRDAAATRSLRAGLRIADERVAVLSDAIAAMCAGCEPEGVCREPTCPLRAHSPLPLGTHSGGDPRTTTAIAAASWTPDRRQKVVDALNRRWADPENRRRQSEQMRERLADPEWAASWADSVRAGVSRRSPESFSAASKKAWARRRALPVPRSRA